MSDWLGFRDLAVAAGSGAVGLIAMAPVLALAWVLGVLQPPAFAGLAEIVGLGPNLWLGLIIFVAGGVTTLPLLFASLAGFLPPQRSIALRGATFAAIVWTGFAFAFHTGQGGLALAGYLGLTLLAHLAYGYALGATFDRYADVPRYEI